MSEVIHVFKFKKFGWRMLEFEIPDTWELSVDAKREDFAYFRLDHVYPRLEVKWEKISKKKPPSLKTSVNEYLKEMQKRAKKSGYEYKVINIREVKVMKHPALSFYVRSTGETLGACWCCPDTERLILFQLVFKREEYPQMYSVFQKILQTMRCHKEGPWLWYFYGFYIRIPESYSLTNYKFTPGFSKAFFKKDDVGLIVAYHTVANVVLDEYGDVDNWFTRVCKPQILENLGALKFLGARNVMINGHEGREFVYVSRFSLFKRLKVLSYSWLCEKLNRLLNVTFYFPQKMERVLRGEIDDILDSSRCH